MADEVHSPSSSSDPTDDDDPQESSASVSEVLPIASEISDPPLATTVSSTTDAAAAAAAATTTTTTTAATTAPHAQQHHRPLTAGERCYLLSCAIIAVLFFPITLTIMCCVCCYGSERLAHDVEEWTMYRKPTRARKRAVKRLLIKSVWRRAPVPTKEDEEEEEVNNNKTDKNKNHLYQQQRHVSECCEICLTDFVEGDAIARSTNPKCPHVFHLDCITEWLAVKYRITATCPVCRRWYLDEKTPGSQVDTFLHETDGSSSPSLPPNDPTTLVVVETTKRSPASIQEAALDDGSSSSSPTTTPLSKSQATATTCTTTTKGEKPGEEV